MTYDRSDVPHALLGLLEAHAEDDQADHGEHEADVAEPQSVFGRWAAAEFLRALVHPEIADSSADLFADDKTNQDAQKLEAQLLRVELEFGKEKLRNLDSEEHAAEAEDDGVGDGGNPDGGVTEKEERLDELEWLEGGRVDALEVEVLLLESRDVVADRIAHVKGLGTKEEVGDELNAVDLSCC